jgi:hypothetical protein
MRPAFSSLCKLLKKFAPRRILHGFGERYRHESFDIQSLNKNRAEVIHDPSGDLVVKVTALISDVRVNLL